MDVPRLLVAVVAHEMEEQALRILHEEEVHGVTVLSGQGIGFPEHMTIFGLTYKGFLSALVSLVPDEHAQSVAERLNHELRLLQPFQGLAFVLPLEEIRGSDPVLPGANSTGEP